MQRGILSLTVFFLAVHLFITLWVLLGSLAQIPVPPVAGDLQTLAAVLFNLSHASYLLGWPQAGVLFGLSAGLSWLFEQAGVATGAIYGAYHYSDMLGPKLGHVPLAIPIAWFMLIYPSYVVANLIADGQPTSRRGGLLWLVWLSFLSAMVVTAWDLAMDPICSGAGLWVWEEGGAYFGVPIQNFVGWMLTAFSIYLLYRLWERRVGTRPLGRLTALWIWLPLLAYGGHLLRTFQWPAMGLVACFTMGIPLLVAAGRASSGLRRSTQP